MRWVIILMIVSVVWQVLGQIVQKQQQQKQGGAVRRPGGQVGPSSGPPRSVEEAIARRRAQLEEMRRQRGGGTGTAPSRPMPATRQAPPPTAAPTRAPARARAAATRVDHAVTAPAAPPTRESIEAALPPLPEFARTKLHDVDARFSGSADSPHQGAPGRAPVAPHPILARFRSRASVRELVLAREILDPPAALR